MRLDLTEVQMEILLIRLDVLEHFMIKKNIVTEDEFNDYFIKQVTAATEERKNNKET